MYVSRFHVEAPEGLRTSQVYKAKAPCTTWLRRRQRWNDASVNRGGVDPIDYSKYRIVETRFVFEKTITHEPSL
ncbi:hypothetical protein [Ralstonia solanacearum]|nr:hypothetical protein [Ralstonia solanacearum]